VIKRSRASLASSPPGEASLEEEQVTVFDGQGALAGSAGKDRTVKVSKDGKAVAGLTAPHVILATGARARSLPGLEPDGKLVWTTRRR